MVSIFASSDLVWPQFTLDPAAVIDSLIQAASSCSAGSGLSVVPMSIAQLAPILLSDGAGPSAEGAVGSARSRAAANSMAIPAAAINRGRDMCAISSSLRGCSVAWDQEYSY